MKKPCKCPCHQPIPDKDLDRAIEHLRKAEEATESEWEYGKLMFDAILSICNLKDADTWDEGLTLSFVPKNATGQAWRELKARMHQITEK